MRFVINATVAMASDFVALFYLFMEKKGVNHHENDS